MDHATAKRAAYILAAANAIMGSAGPIAISLGGLAGQYLLTANKALATAPVTGFNVGVALATLPAAALIRRLGHRSGFLAGAVVTAGGGALAAYALFAASFPLFAAGLALIGGGNAFAQQYRFAAADAAPDEKKGAAISIVLAGGVFTALIGPEIVILTSQAFPSAMFAGAFVAVVGLAVVGAAILALLPATPLRAARHTDAGEPVRPLREIVFQPQFAVALLCAISSYALMSFVMTGAPLAMVGCGYTANEATRGISLHVMAMYAPSFFTGHLITRFGARAIVAFGLTLLVGCAALALTGLELWRFWGALVLLGLGWNFGFIGATAIVARCYRSSEKAKAQGFHDFALFGSVALSSLLSGAVYDAFGWSMLNWAIPPVALSCLALLGLAGRAGRAPAAAR